MPITNVKVGACSVSFGGTDLGYTKGGCEVTIETKRVEITVDETGETIRDLVTNGTKATVKVMLAETGVANLANVLPTATLEETDTRLKFGEVAGQRMLALAKELVLRPLGLGDDTEDVVFYQAVSIGEMNAKYNNEEERVIEVTFEALWDETKGALGHIGVAPIV